MNFLKENNIFDSLPVDDDDDDDDHDDDDDDGNDDDNDDDNGEDDGDYDDDDDGTDDVRIGNVFDSQSTNAPIKFTSFKVSNACFGIIFQEGIGGRIDGPIEGRMEGWMDG